MDRWIGWTTNSEQAPRRYNAVAWRLDGAATFRLNEAGTTGFFGDVLEGADTAIFQQVDYRRGRSDIHTYNLQTRTRFKAPVSTKAWEWRPAISSNFILFGRNRFDGPKAPWKVIVYDRQTHDLTALDSVPNSCACIWPGWVGDRYATWTKCPAGGCNTYYWDSQTGETKRVPNPRDKEQYAAVVDEIAGQVRFVRSGDSCGLHVTFLRWDIGTSDPPLVVAMLPDNIDTDFDMDLAATVTGHTDLFEWFKCRAGAADVYALRDADTVTTPIPLPSSRAGAVMPVPKRLRHAPDAMPR